MCNKPKDLNLPTELMEYLSEELEFVDPEYARLKFYTLLLDKYSVPDNHPLRVNTQHHLSVEQLDTLLKENGFNRFKKRKNSVH